MVTSEISHLTHLVKSEAANLRQFLAELSQEEWLRPSACAGWAVGDVAAHLTQSAYTWSEGITRAQAGDAGPPPGQQPLRPGERGSEVTAQRAIDLRQEKGKDQLLEEFSEGYNRLGQVLQELQPEDWDKPCFHRRGILPVRDYVGLRVQELAIHGWDMRSAFDDSAEPSEQPLAVMVDRMVPRWLTNTFSREGAPPSPVRYRFDVAGPVPVHQDLVVEGEKFSIEPVSGGDADVTFRCNTGNYLLLIYGRLDLSRGVPSARLEVSGNRELATLFNALFRGV
jgi:uncharacterized protein (TIGR03083 family)